MEQKIIATVGGHQITEAEVEAFIHSLPREQQAYAAHPDFRKHKVSSAKKAIHVFSPFFEIDLTSICKFSGYKILL